MAPSRSRRASLPFRLCGVAAALPAVMLIACGCDRRGPRLPQAEVHRLRAAARIQHDLGTEEGYRRAAALLERLVWGGEGDLRDRLNLARALVFTRDAERAGAVLARARGSFQGEPPIALAYLEGLAAKRREDLKTAAAKFAETTGLDPTCVSAWYQLGLARSQLRDPDGAIRAYERVADLDRAYFAEGALNSIQLLHRRAGREEEADRSLERFKRLKEERAKTAPPGNPPAEFYEQNRHTRSDLTPAARAETEPPVCELTFDDLTAALPPPLGRLGGVRDVAAFDLEGDGDLDLYATCEAGNRLLRSDGAAAPGGAPAMSDITELSDAAGPGGGTFALPADFTNDGLVDLYLASREDPGVLLRGLGEGVFQPLPRAGLEGGGEVLAAQWADVDHDGDLDLVLLERQPAGEARVRALRNLGDGTFAALGAADEFPGTLGRPAAAALAFDAGDLDLGNDLDLILPGAEGDLVVYLNRRQGPFRRLEIAGTRGAALALAGDLDDDGDPDLLALPAAAGAAARLAFGEDPEAPGGPRFRVEAQAALAGLPEARSGELCDLDNDGDLDVLIATVQGPRILRNSGGGRLALHPPGAGGPWNEPLRRARAADLDGDGLLDLLLVTGAGRIAVLRARAAPAYASVVLRLVGQRDNRDGIGAVVEIHAGSAYQARQARAAGGVRVGLGRVHGIGEDAGAGIDGLRITWPNGVVQAVLPAELRWGSGRRADVVQKSGLNVSCPYLYGFDGEAMRFITDVVGIAPLDEWLPEGGSPLLLSEEEVRIEGPRLQARAGRIALAITEELRETTYLDAVELVEAVHAAGTELYLDESTPAGGPEPEGLLSFARRRVGPPAAVRRPDGADGLEAVRAADGRYLHAYGGASSQWAGWVEPAALEIDLPPGEGGATLLLQGRIAWPDSDVVFALSQSGRRWSAPRLDVWIEPEGGEAGWSTAIADIGFPRGMDRTLALPVPEGARRVRIVAGHRFLWDRIAVGRGGEPPLDLRRRVLPLRSAVLRYHGRSRAEGDAARHEASYDLSRALPADEFRRAQGLATRYGDVRELVSPRADDRVVVMVAGDRLDLEFEAPPPLAGGGAGERTWFLRLVGWAKEGSFHNRTGRWIAPLPFHGMEGYPPARARPADGAYAEYLRRYQTRWVDR